MIHWALWFHSWYVLVIIWTCTILINILLIHYVIEEAIIFSYYLCVYFGSGYNLTCSIDSNCLSRVLWFRSWSVLVIIQTCTIWLYWISASIDICGNLYYLILSMIWPPSPVSAESIVRRLTVHLWLALLLTITRPLSTGHCAQYREFYYNAIVIVCQTYCK